MFYKFIAVYVLFLLTILVIRLNPKRREINNLVRSIEEFIYNYDAVKDIINQDMNVGEIIHAINPHMKNLDIAFLSFDFGMIKTVPFRNTKELRQCFLAAGDFILKYEEMIERKYNYQYEYTDYNVFAEALKTIRAECMSRNENASFDIKVK